MVICDEIHNTYSEQNNSYYNTINSINNQLGDNVKLIYMSATPILRPSNTSHIINLLNTSDVVKTDTIVPVDKFREYIDGKVIVHYNINSPEFPGYEFMGDTSSVDGFLRFWKLQLPKNKKYIVDTDMVQSTVNIPIKDERDNKYYDIKSVDVVTTKLDFI